MFSFLCGPETQAHVGKGGHWKEVPASICSCQKMGKLETKVHEDLKKKLDFTKTREMSQSDGWKSENSMYKDHVKDSEFLFPMPHAS